jgi:uncharacterized protein (DUF2236 family)
MEDLDRPSGQNDPRDDFFAEGSVLRGIHEERVVGLWALLRAGALQAAHPRAFAIFELHRGPEEELFRRLARTAKALEAVLFGSRSQAQAVGARTRQLHAGMSGVFPADAPGGLTGSYQADEPELLLWVLEAIVDSVVVIYTLVFGPLADVDCDALWDDVLRVGELFGLSRRDAPGSGS